MLKKILNEKIIFKIGSKWKEKRIWNQKYYVLKSKNKPQNMI